MEMKFYLDLLIEILLIASAASIINTIIIQKTKGLLPTGNTKLVTLYSILVNIIFGYLFCLIFTDANWVYSLAVAFLSFIGADAIYKELESKGIVAKFQEMKNKTTIEISKEDIIEREK